MNKRKKERRNEIQNEKILPKNKRTLFIKTFLISLTVILVLFISGVVILKSMVKPPAIAQNDEQNVPTLEDVAFLPPNGDERDILIGGGLDAPEGFTIADRKEQFYTFLIIGLDEGINTDTIMIASYDGILKEANIISVPRDSMVNVKRKIKKINAAYPAGTLNGGGLEGGINQLKREIKTIIGFVPDFYVCVDLDAFVKIVDAVGGVNINVRSDMKYYDPTQNLHIDIKKGEQLLDGENALKFARYRKGNDPRTTITDYQRMENQQAVIKALFNKLLKPANILKIPEFIKIFNEYVYSDIKPENMLWFAEQLNKIKGTEALSTYTIPTKGTSGLPNYYEYLDETAIVELINKTINPYKKDIGTRDLDIIVGD